MTRERILFVTGKLAEPSLRRVVSDLSSSAEFDYSVNVMGISVAALLHVDWVRRHLDGVAGFNRVVLPGWCRGDVGVLTQHFGTTCELGPKDLSDLPEFFGREQRGRIELNDYDIEILAEINHAPRMTDAEILAAASRYRENGADVIDLGCLPGERWNRVRDAAKRLCDEGFRVSIDSFDRDEVEQAVDGGAELVLSCNGGNRDWAVQLGVELVAVPDDPHDLSTLNETVDALAQHACRFRIDPVLEPIGFGFAASLSRYFETRRKWPDAEIMMGIGNLTELTEVDTAGANVMLAGICQELGIRSVLTTQLYFPGEARNSGDSLYKPELLMGVSENPHALTTRFDFVLDLV